MTVAPANVIISKTDGTGTRTVTIATSQTEQVWQKELNSFNVPKTTDDQNMTDGGNDVKFIDLLLKLQKRITITGKVATDVGTDTHSDAYDKKEDLKKIFFGGGTFSLIMEGDTYKVNADKFQVSWKANDKPTITSFGVTLSCIEGVDL